MSKNDGNVIDYVSALEQECFSDGWSTDSIKSSLGQSCNVLIVAYLDEATEEGGELFVQGGTGAVLQLEEMWNRISCPLLCGYLIANMAGDESELLRIAVAPAKRKMHIANRLMEKYEKYVNAKSYYLEVRQKNAPARSLYKKFGYKEIGGRKNYYVNPIEDAVIYSKTKMLDDKI